MLLREQELVQQREQAAIEQQQRDIELEHIHLREQAELEAAMKRSHEDENHATYLQQLQEKLATARKDYEEMLQAKLADDEHECVICEDEFPLKNGIVCRNPKCKGSGEVEVTFICDVCFGSHVKQQAGDPLAKLQERDGRVTCVVCKTPFDYEEYELALHLRLHKDAFPAYLQSRRKLYEHKMKVDSAKAVKKQVAKELARLAKMSEEERKLDEACTHIRESILTNKCPRCNQAFVDFTGCFALTCSRRECGAGFCAYCLKDCGSDAHIHVKRCPLNKSTSVFSTKKVFEECSRLRRTKALDEYLAPHTPRDSCTIVLKLLTDLKDLGLMDIVQKYVSQVVPD